MADVGSIAYDGIQSILETDSVWLKSEVVHSTACLMFDLEQGGPRTQDGMYSLEVSTFRIRFSKSRRHAAVSQTSKVL